MMDFLDEPFGFCCSTDRKRKMEEPEPLVEVPPQDDPVLRCMGPWLQQMHRCMAHVMQIEDASAQAQSLDTTRPDYAPSPSTKPEKPLPPPLPAWRRLSEKAPLGISVTYCAMSSDGKLIFRATIPKKARTGFEEKKDYQPSPNAVIANRYQVRFL